MHSYTKSIYGLHVLEKNEEDALKMKQYMRNYFEFFGIRAPKMKELSKQFLKENGCPSEHEFELIFKELWNLPEREMQLFALSLMDKKCKMFRENDIELIEFSIVNKSWWDTVDHIAIHHVGSYFSLFPDKIKEITKKWIESGNVWLQRSAILFQLKYKEKTDEYLLFSFIKQLSSSKEFFIQKSIGWALREYSKTNPSSVISFVNTNKLSALPHREALKFLNKKENNKNGR